MSAINADSLKHIYGISDADARIYAAAPEMFVALWAVPFILTGDERPGVIRELMRNWWGMYGQQAMAKAEGVEK